MPLDAGFLSLLTARVTVEGFAGEDSWGNASFDPPRIERAFISPVSSTLGAVDGDRQQSRVINATEIIMDFVGIRPGDKITLPGGTITYVTAVTTDKDEVGADLYQTVTVQDTERG